jgi:hypothetical protein
MKVGDVVEFVGSWRNPEGPKVGIVMETWTNGRTKKLSSADVFWDNGSHGNVLVQSLAVISESR